MHAPHVPSQPFSVVSMLSLRLLAGDSAKLITGSADSSARLWDLQTGKALHAFKFNEPCRAVKFAVGDAMAAISSDPFMGVPACIYLVTIAEDAAEQNTTILQQLKGPTGRIQRVEWTDLNRTLISAGEDGHVRRWDVEVRAAACAALPRYTSYTCCACPWSSMLPGVVVSACM
jgi:WD40 repeat protein